MAIHSEQVGGLGLVAVAVGDEPAGDGIGVARIEVAASDESRWGR